MLSSIPIAAIGALVVASLTGYVLALNIMAGNTVAALACMAGVLAIAAVSGVAVAKHEDLLDGDIHHPDPSRNALTGLRKSRLQPLPENLGELIAAKADGSDSASPVAASVADEADAAAATVEETAADAVSEDEPAAPVAEDATATDEPSEDDATNENDDPSVPESLDEPSEIEDAESDSEEPDEPEDCPECEEKTENQ